MTGNTEQSTPFGPHTALLFFGPSRKRAYVQLATSKLPPRAVSLPILVRRSIGNFAGPRQTYKSSVLVPFLGGNKPAHVRGPGYVGLFGRPCFLRIYIHNGYMTGMPSPVPRPRWPGQASQRGWLASYSTSAGRASRHNRLLHLLLDNPAQSTRGVETGRWRQTRGADTQSRA